MSLTLEGVKTSPMGLRAVQDLVSKLRIEGVVYCHWKSNEHLEEGMLGLTDLDMLFDRASAVKLARVLSDSGYKRFAATPGRSYPGVEDYLGFDTETGRLIHLHLHYELTAGEKHLKGYHLPWEDWVLSTRRFDERGQVYVADPNVEMLLLLVRSLLKIRLRSRLIGVLGRRYFRGGELVEYRWLKERIQADRLAGLAQTLLGEGAARRIVEIVGGEPSLRQLVGLRRAARPILALYRTYGPVEARTRRWVRELLWLRSALGRTLTHPAAPLSRTNPRGGLMIAFMGPDGSGKSTVVRGLVKWLSWKIDARPVYFGSGDGPASLLRWPLKLALKAVQKVGLLRAGGQSAAAGREKASGGVSGSGLGRYARPIWALVLAFEKRRTLRRAWKGRNLGLVMICDRYPQYQVMGFNDGPLLGPW